MNDVAFYFIDLTITAVVLLQLELLRRIERNTRKTHHHLEAQSRIDERIR